MSNKIRIKKSILQYGYLKLEKQEVDIICENMEKEMRDYFEKNFPSQFKKFNELKQRQMEEHIQAHIKDEKNQDKINEDKEQPPTESIKDRPKINPDIKKMYRKIVEYSHPDKIGNNNNSQVFSDAAEAYKTKNVAKLLDIASSLNIEFTALSKETMSQLEKNISLLNEVIINKKSTTAWQWHKAEDEETKVNIIMHILNCEGII